MNIEYSLGLNFLKKTIWQTRLVRIGSRKEQILTPARQVATPQALLKIEEMLRTIGQRL